MQYVFWFLLKEEKERRGQDENRERGGKRRVRKERKERRKARKGKREGEGQERRHRGRRGRDGGKLVCRTGCPYIDSRTHP